MIFEDERDLVEQTITGLDKARGSFQIGNSSCFLGITEQNQTPTGSILGIHMHIISRRSLVAFWNKHPDAKSPLTTWYTIARKAVWKKPQDVRDVFASASFLKNDVVVFEIGGQGKGYRLSGGMQYTGIGRVFVRHVMTHDEYLRRTRDGDL